MANRIEWGVGALALAAVAVVSNVRADVVAGDRITADTVEQVRALVSPGLEWCIRHGLDPMFLFEPDTRGSS